MNNSNEAKIYSFLGLAQRAGKLVSGDDSTMLDIKKNKVNLVIVADDASNITIENNLEGAGFMRINPNATNQLTKVVVNYTSRAKSGDANEQVWQYVGAPGEDAVMSSTENAKIYYWSETDGWVKHSADFEPFK